MEAVFLRILNIALTTGWLVLAVLLLRFVLKKAPRWVNCLLWGVVALRLLLPFSLESALSLIPNAEPIPESIIITETPDVNDGFEGVDQVPGQTPNQAPNQTPNQTPNQAPDQVVDSEISGSLAPTPENSADPMQVLVLAASIVWISGIVLMLGYGAFSYFRLKHKVRASLCKEGRIYLCDSIETPFILGVFRPRIYLPSGMADSEIPYVLAHEEAHLKRKDHLWKPLGFLLLSVYWFHPLLWVGYFFLCRDIENACDEKAIKNSDKAYKVGYAEALLACSIHRRTVMACPVAFGETGVKSRIRSVLHYKKPAFWVIVVAILVLIVTCVCFLTNPVTDQDETTTAPSTTETPVTTGKTPAINLPSDPFAFHEPGPTIYSGVYENGNHSGVYENGNRWFLATVTGVTSDSVLVKPHDECDESELYTSENPLILPKSLYKNAFQDESQVAYLQIGDEIRVSYQGEIGTAKFVSFGWMYFSTIRSITTADLNQDGVKEEYINAWGFASGLYDGRLVIRDPAGQKTWLYCIYHESPLVGVIDIVTDSDGRVILYNYDGNEKVALGEILYQKERDYFYIDMYNSTTPEAPETLPPVEAEINAITETAYWQQVHRMNPITWQRNSDGSISYVWSLTIKIAEGLFPSLAGNYSESLDGHGMALINIEDVDIYIKDVMYDSDYTKYSITPSSWKTARGCDIWFEAEGFVPNYDSFYDMYFVFNLPDDDSETLYPGKHAYIWAEGEPWSCWLPSVAVSSLEACLAESYHCTLISHNQKYSIEHTNGYANGTPPENFPTSPFSFSISTEDGLFNSKEAWQAIYGEGVFAYVMGGIDTEFTRYEIDYMLVEGQGDMWFTLKDFTPVAGETYEIYLFFMAGEGAKHEYQWHYVYANDWIAGAHE